METLVKTHLCSKQDWEKNFKALKVRGKEAERLPRYSVTLIFCLNNVFYQNTLYSEIEISIEMQIQEFPVFLKY